MRRADRVPARRAAATLGACACLAAAGAALALTTAPAPARAQAPAVHTATVAISLGGGTASSVTTTVPVTRQSSAGVTAAARAAASSAATVTVGGDSDAPAVPYGFLGLSIEYPDVPKYAEAGARFDQVLANLTPRQRPVIRVGGQSTDHAWIPVTGVHNFGLYDDLYRRWLKELKQLATSTRARMVMGLNFEVNEPSVPVREAAAFTADLGRSLGALELGNEPDLYTVFPWYETHGRKIFTRDASWGPVAYAAQERATVPRLGDAALWGPALDNGSRWWQSISTITAAAPHLSTLTYHGYATSCFTTPSSIHWPSIADLLSPTASVGLATQAAPDIAYAHATGRAFRIDEINTVSCNGTRALPSFASALWALEAGFALTSAGVNGINIHTNPSSQTRIFSFRRGAVSVADEYYGWMMFARAAPPGSRLRSVSSSGNASIEADATRLGATTRVVLINDSYDRPGTVSLAVPGTSQATVEPLRGPGMTVAGGVSFAGLRIATASGRLTGTPRVTSLSGPGEYSVALPPASADLITVTR